MSDHTDDVSPELRSVLDGRPPGRTITIADVERWEDELRAIYPDNDGVIQVFRNVMEDFRDEGWILFNRDEERGP